jgi:hypothetical protein
VTVVTIAHVGFLVADMAQLVVCPVCLIRGDAAFITAPFNEVTNPLSPIANAACPWWAIAYSAVAKNDNHRRQQIKLPDLDSSCLCAKARYFRGIA